MRNDVNGLQELSQKLNKSCFDNFGVNLYKFISTSQLTYSIWISKRYAEGKWPIYLQTPEQEKFFRQSIYGGRTYKYKHEFVSSQREAFLNEKLNFDDIEDYLIDADVNSLYPAAMKEEYPTGVPLKLDDESIKDFNGFLEKFLKCPKFGIFKVEYISNKNLIDCILPRRENGKLIWALKDGDGIYNSIDLNNALICGYKESKERHSPIYARKTYDEWALWENYSKTNFR